MTQLKRFGVLLLSTLVFIACSEEDNSNNQTDEALYTIVNNGLGAVDGETDSDDNEALGIAQAVPSVQNATYPKSMPIILFFNDKLDTSTIESNFEVTENGEMKGGTITINEAANGYAILTFIPKNGFEPNASIELTLKSGFSDDGGNSFDAGEDYIVAFSTDNTPTGNFDNNGSFENGSDGVIFLGDGNIMQGTQGCVSATEGNDFAAITSGDSLVSSENAIGDASSMMILGPITSDVTNVSFDYNFLSAEFQEWVYSEFDDSVLLTIVGDAGVYSQFLTSVNTVGTTNTQCDGFAGMPDDGDPYSGETGWINQSIDVGDVGSSAFIIFTVTDVTDHIFSSALTIDNVIYN
ncbi:MAG: hypothetical protein HRU50_04520 [Winogradskyella sp.]|uniref:Ig-like domain-containing protein n=1 Tax=Winogradskyella sp. TaxID=1883156 RepID=UPI0025DC2139|nr:Ig-like domain-containing protein [Winogradskyella sp.]NRB59189.1 hypothetical protein [Winogradskyella sp.]